MNICYLFYYEKKIISGTSKKRKKGASLFYHFVKLLKKEEFDFIPRRYFIGCVIHKFYNNYFWEKTLVNE